MNRALNRPGRYLAGSSVALGVALGFVACSTPFSPGASSGGTDAGAADGNRVDAPGSGHADGGVDASTVDAAMSDGSVVDSAGNDGPIVDTGGGGPCLGAFSTPTLVLAHTTQYLVDSITLTSDELDAFVTLMPAGVTTEQRKVYAMHRASAGAAFAMDTSQPLDLTSVGPTPGAFDVALGADGLTLYFSHRQDTDAGMLAVDIYEAQRGNAGATFSASSRFGPGIDDPTTDQFHAHPAGTDLYFTVAPIVAGAQGQRDLYMASLQGGARTAITELNGPTTQEATPVPSRDELEIFFSSDRAAPGGNSRVYTARRTSAALAFPSPALAPLSIPDASTNVTPQHLTADRCRLYVVVDQQDAFVSQRAP